MFNRGLGNIVRKQLFRFQSTSVISPKSAIITPNILDLRVGYIRDIKRHENADTLYVSQIQIGPDEQKDIVQVCSGLVGLVPLEKLHQSRVVIVNNLKPSRMRGVKSEAMLLCADAETGEGQLPLVDPVVPPLDAELGQPLHFADTEPVSEKKRLKSKQFADVAGELTVDNKHRVVWRSSHILEGCTAGKNDSHFVGARVR